MSRFSETDFTWKASAPDSFVKPFVGARRQAHEPLETSVSGLKDP